MSDQPTAAALTDDWTVSVDHPAFPGHFPGRPILPGVVILDRALWLAGRLAAPDARWQVGQAKFFSPVEPGETLRFVLTATRPLAWRFDVHAGARHIAAGVLTATLP